MSSNCYIIYDNSIRHCIVIDPGSEHSLREIDFIESGRYSLDYIVLTHEHTDHTWGCNALIEKYPFTKIVCSEKCAQELPHSSDAYFRFYMDDPDYQYKVKKVDITVHDKDILDWNYISIEFIMTPGHTGGSMCFTLNNILFTGDTIMKYKLFTNKRFGSYEQMRSSISKLLSTYHNKGLTVYPGHGEIFKLDDYDND